MSDIFSSHAVTKWFRRSTLRDRAYLFRVAARTITWRDVDGCRISSYEVNRGQYETMTPKSISRFQY